MVKHWRMEVAHCNITPDCWDSLAKTGGKLRPISLMRHTLQKANEGCRAWDHWVVGGREVRIRFDLDAAEAMAAVIAARWRKLGKQR